MITKNGITLCDRFVKSVMTPYGIRYEDREILTAPVQRMKVKYEQALAGIAYDPRSEAQDQANPQAEVASLGITSEIADLLCKGDKGGAIKLAVQTFRPDIQKGQFTKEHAKQILETLNNAERALKSKYPERFSSQKSGCFIATACYGDYDHPTVKELRHFRDNYLATSSTGRAFVRWYYQWSPVLAGLVAKSGILKTISSVLIVTPVVAIARLLEREPEK